MKQCWKCDRDLTGQKYMEHDKHPVCMRCYKRHYAKQCEYCMEYIIDSPYSTYESKHWHKTCFNCTDCRQPLSGKSFNIKGNSRVYCLDCYDGKFTGNCVACDKPFTGGEKKFRYNEKLYHEACFVCNVCKEPMGEKSFYPKDDGYTCEDCHGKKSDVCRKCNKKITSGAIVYKEQSYHRDCFVCTSCATTLAGIKFANQDGAYYCVDCYTKLFSKVCHVCNKPATGLDGKYLSYEDKTYHSSCFNCAKCKKNIAEEKFVPKGDGVLCTSCA